MVVTHNEITNAIVLAEDVSMYIADARLSKLSNGETPCKEDNDQSIEIEAWIEILERCEVDQESGCIDDDDIWAIIQKVNELAQETNCYANGSYSRNSSSGGGGNPPSGYVERVLGVNVDNSNPSRPVINIVPDGITIMGSGTQADPFYAVGGAGSGTVNLGTQYRIAYYATTGTAVSQAAAITPNRALISDANGVPTHSSVTAAVLAYLDATSSVQTQLNSKITNPMTTGGDIIYGGGSGVPTRLANGSAGQVLQSNGTTTAPSWATLPTSGNTNTVYLNNAAILALETGSDLDLDTFYVVTDALPYPVMVTAEAINMIGKSARIVHDIFGGHGHYDATGNAFVGTIWDVSGNVFQGNSTGNVLATSVNNFFNASSSNDLTNSGSNVFTFADANILVDCGNNNFGINSTSNTLTNCGYNTFESNNQNIILDTSSYNIFKSGVVNLNSINASFDYCIVAGGDYSGIDFTNAAQLFGRSVVWSINKVLGTDLLEVTFDANLSTAQTGTYGTSTDTFTPYAAGGVASVVAGTNISVDNTDPANPIVTSLSDRYKTTSATSNSISNGSKTFTVDANLSYIALQEVLIVYDASNHMHGTVTSYSGTTLIVDVKTNTGSGTYTSWSINLDGTPVDAITGVGTANRIAYFTAGQIIDDLDTATYPSLTELSYVKGVTSAIQTQLNALANTQTLTCIGLVITTVNDASNYHIGTIAATPSGTDARRAFKPTSNCTVTAAALTLEQVTNGSNETVSVYLRNVTDATETLIGTFTSDFGASTTLKTLFSGLSIALVTTKDYTIRITTPTWGTNPSQWIPSVTLQMTL